MHFCGNLWHDLPHLLFGTAALLAGGGYRLAIVFVRSYFRR